MLKFKQYLLAFTAALTLVACGGGGGTPAAGGGTTPTLQAIVVTPATPNVVVGQTQQLVATGTYSDGTSAALSNATWTSSSAAIVTITSTGLVKGVMTGPAVITAAVGTVTGNTTVIVKAATTSIALSLTNTTQPAVPVGFISNFKATATQSTGTSITTTQDVTSTAAWASSNTAVATVANGVVTPLSAGTTNITASTSGQVGTYALIVSSATLTGLTINGMTQTNFAQDDSLNLSVTAKYSDVSTYTVPATWTSSDTTKATVANALFTAVAPGTVTLTAAYQGMNAAKTVTIATPLSTPLIAFSCNSAVPMTLKASDWNAKTTSDPSNLTKWLVVDKVSCAGKASVVLIDVTNNYLIYGTDVNSSGGFNAGQTFSTNRTPQLTAGNAIKVGSSNYKFDPILTIYNLLYTVTAQ